MNSNLRRTCSVVVVLVLVLAGALVQPFGGNATAGPNGEGTLQGTWRVGGTPTNSQKGASPPVPSFSSFGSSAPSAPPPPTMNATTFPPPPQTPRPCGWSHTQAHPHKAP